MNADALSELMRVETDSPPPARIDLAVAMRDGRRRRRRRTLMAPAVAGVAVLALAAGTAVVVNEHRAAPTHPAPAATTSTAPAPAAFNPLRLRLAADWIPDGFIAEPTVTAPTGQRIRFVGPGEVGMVDVTLYAAGITPLPLKGDRYWPMPSIQAAAPVGGHPAQLWTHRSTRDQSLAWQWAPGAWVVTMALLPEGVNTSDVLRRFTDNVRTDADLPNMLPFTMATPPAPLRLATVSTREQAPLHEYTLDLSFADIPRLPWRLDVSGPTPEVSIGVAVDNQPHEPAPNRVIGGHPAHLWDDESNRTLTLYGVAGYRVEASVNTTAGRDQISVNQLIAMALSVVPRGLPSDRSQWTDRPLG